MVTILYEVQILAKEKSFIFVVVFSLWRTRWNWKEIWTSSKLYSRIQPHGRITIHEIKASFARRL